MLSSHVHNNNLLLELPEEWPEVRLRLGVSGAGQFSLDPALHVILSAVEIFGPNAQKELENRDANVRDKLNKPESAGEWELPSHARLNNQRYSRVASYPQNLVNDFLVPIVVSCAQSFTKSLRDSFHHKQVIKNCPFSNL